eukprot:CAMPEP_0118928998 /NCGR_PEP_ID=MMETSP1169-20130426/6130_1 /TAXON_ID=36882 /ORGANISM="Pyramimonas obovata, Strain CCMP722" /LENGTH=323 /DNA_ID=CAMNT_0006871111 /DNA_START=19 /DNA_END=990 /DNA_ORIENTATION=+
MSSAVAMMSKVKNKKGRRALERSAPKWNENAKRVLLAEGGKTSALTKSFLGQVHILKKGESVKFSRKNDQLKPFETGGEVPLEFMCQKNDCSLFAVASHNKKRPHNIVLGRMFDYHLYDQLEIGIESMKTIQDFGSAAAGAGCGTKPLIIFMGEKFETQPEFKALKSLLTDLLRGQTVDKIALMGLDRVVLVAEANDKVYFRQCVMKFKKSGTRVPRVELAEMGPSLDITLRRHRPPAAELEKEAMRAPPAGKKVKNTSVDALGETYGRVYLPGQEVDEMALRKMKGLKRERRESAAAKAEAAKPENEQSVVQKKKKNRHETD